MKKIFTLLFLFQLILNAQTNFLSLGSSNSGGSGFKTIGSNSNIIVSNVMINDGTEMYHGSAVAKTNYTVGPFTIKGNGTNTNVFTFEDLHFRGFSGITVDAAHSKIIFKAMDGTTIRTMTLNANKYLGTTSTSVTGFFDNGTSVPIANVAEIIVEVYQNSGQANQQNSANFNYVNIHLSNYALPVELTSFTASVNNSSVNLTWETTTELNNYGFEVQKQESEARSQNSEWEQIGFIKGSGNSNSPKSYSFVDETVASGNYKYRLKQIDNDGSFEYSSVVEVNVELPEKFSLEQNYPNPFNPSTKISFFIPVEGHVQLKVYNVQGAEVTTLINENKPAGKHITDFNAENLSSGIYFYTLQFNGNQKTNSMILLR